MSRTSTLPKRLQPMLATLTDAPFDDPGWVFEDKYDGFRMIAEIRRGKVALYSRNGKIISRSYIEVAKALEGVKGDAVIDGELAGRHIDLRPFVFMADRVPTVAPGALTRVALGSGDVVVNSSRAGGGKDTWVLC